jgi:hypothetical protein
VHLRSVRLHWGSVLRCSRMRRSVLLHRPLLLLLLLLLAVCSLLLRLRLPLLL